MGDAVRSTDLRPLDRRALAIEAAATLAERQRLESSRTLVVAGGL